jgi:hypothetical protein
MRPRCQLYCLPKVADENVEARAQSIRRRIKLMLKRHLSPYTKRNLKKIVARWVVRFSNLFRRSASPPARSAAVTDFQAGDLVRIRSREEIEATLNCWHEFRGCAFMDEMWQYCGTTQRVFKPVRYFLDERDYRLKKCKGLVILEGVICEGMKEYGPCDRSCFFFWRDEWLEKID